MAGVRLRQAFAAGFVLIRRRPVAVFAWGVLLVLFVQAPILFFLGRAASEFLPLLGGLRPGSPQAASALALEMQRRMMPMQAIMLPAMAVRVLVSAAVIRAVLEPRERAFASLRIGRQEAWLLLLAFAFMAIGYLAAIPVSLVIFAGAMGAALLRAPFDLIGPAAIVAAVAAGLWALARLSLAAPMTFSDRTFRLFESWSATRRQGLRLMGLGLMVFLFTLAVALLLAGLACAAALAAAGGWPLDGRRIGAWIAALSVLDPGQAAVWLVPAGLAAAAIHGATSAIVVAPWASAYQQLNLRPAMRA